MRVINVREIDSTLESLRSESNKHVKKRVSAIISDIRKNGNKALKAYEKRFNNVTLRSLKVSASEIKLAYSKVSEDQVKAIKLAKRRLERSEIAVKNLLRGISISNDGIRINMIFYPLCSVVCYTPGGTAQYPSTVVMSVVPAKVAGVKKIVAVSPAYQEGSIDPLTLVSADICGVDEFYKISGAQAIAALAYGTRSIPKVDKIVGPGGVFVSLAKSLLADVVSIDMMAGLILVGKNTPSAASDYLLGSNHILPTNGFGRTRGSLGVLDYMKLETRIESSKDTLQGISKYMKALTYAEGLPNHYEAVRRRL